MPLRQHKRNKKAYALSKRLRLRFYKVAATATIAYVALSLVSFHAELSYLPYLAVMWAVFLFCYTTFKEVLRWSDAGDEEVYHGEFWAALVIAGAIWMMSWNLVRVWILNIPALHFPEDYQGAVIETLVLYTLSVISSFLYKNKQLKEHSVRQRTHRKAASRPSDVPKEEIGGASQEKSPEIGIALTKTSMLDKKEESPPQKES